MRQKTTERQKIEKNRIKIILQKIIFPFWEGVR
jgi:hypothetical protein